MNHQDEDNPEFPGGLGGLLPAEVLKKLNLLLELLHQAERNKQGSMVINIFEHGSQHVDHVENQYFGICPQPSTKGRETKPGDLPEVLATEEAMTLWKKVQNAGYIDHHYQPLLSRTQSALLADAIAEHLGIKEKWKTFETLWNRKNMYRDYYQALDQRKSLIFQDEMKKVLS